MTEEARSWAGRQTQSDQLTNSIEATDGILDSSSGSDLRKRGRLIGESILTFEIGIKILLY